MSRMTGLPPPPTVSCVDLTIPSSSASLISCWVKEKMPKGLSLAAIVILACLAVGLISSPAVADVSVSK